MENICFIFFLCTTIIIKPTTTSFLKLVLNESQGFLGFSRKEKYGAHETAGFLQARRDNIPFALLRSYPRQFCGSFKVQKI